MSEQVREVVKLSLNIEDYLNYYGHEASCGNCGCRNHCYILKGRALNGLEMLCSRCSCVIPFRRADGDGQ